jgi:hypothetical protein
MVPVTAQDAARLAAEIESERRHLDHTVAEIQSRSSATDDTTIYALALLLMNYYTGAEKIFQRIAALLGGIPPAGDRWHAQLLEDMALDIPAVRPAVLRKETADALSGFLRFRHAIRNLYAWTIRRADMDVHLAALADLHQRLGADLNAFRSFLGGLSAI